MMVCALCWCGSSAHSQVHQQVGQQSLYWLAGNAHHSIVGSGTCSALLTAKHRRPPQTSVATHGLLLLSAGPATFAE
jgi:hypothetical protein